MKQPDLDKYAEEMNAVQDLPPASVELPALATIAIISHIQLASRHPQMIDDAFGKIAIDAARQLQNLFDPKSEIYQILDLGWDSDADDFWMPEGSDIARHCESVDDYAGEDIMDRYIDPEEFNNVDPPEYY